MLDREQKWQKKWDDAQAFEANPDSREKFFCTFPYPYVNGLPHVGHLFSIMRTEVFARYQRLQGKNVLFPQGWHATGSPIATAANRVKEGDDKQINILKDLGVPDNDIQKFAEPEHWIDYFAPRYKKDLSSVGLSIDWRREFHTTSLNPQYDKFITWQFLKLKEKNLVRQGEHPVVWCPKENTPVGDHDRIEGEGETPQEFLLVKHKLDDGRFLTSATLRPDTILGITNLYVHPDLEYVEFATNGETWIVSEIAARHLQEQGHDGNITGKVAGRDLIGQETTEFSGERVLILPATFLDPKFGTGLVHSVPSDSADDLIALHDLQKNEEFLHEYGLDVKKVQAIKVIEVLDTPGIGGNPAQHFLDKFDVKHQNERKKLDKIRPELYKLSFYEATFNKKYEKYSLAGVPVQEGKEKIQQIVIDEGWATTYYQLTGRVVSRANVEAIVKIVSDQWFMAYDDPEWKKQAHEALAEMTLYPEQVRKQFSYVIDWLRAWACTREFGLGTRLPWADEWLIESLSDSTIYMAYYTVAHLIRDVPAEQLTPEFFDYVLLGKGTKPDVSNVDEMRDSFLYWYPMDFRNSGKDLIQNHLTFMLFNHAAIFPKEHWPRAIGANGWVTVNGQKMSKSLGNVIPVRQLIGEYGADATRITIMNGGEGLDDPNWDSDFARGMHGKLDSFIQLAERLRERDEDDPLVDKWLLSESNRLIKKTTEAMEATNFRSAIQLAFFEYRALLRNYMKRTGKNTKALRDAYEKQLIMCSVFIPHACEEAWEVLGNEGLASLAQWPAVDEAVVDDALAQSEEMIASIVDTVKRANTKGSTLKLYLAADWKRQAFAEFDKVAANTRHPGEIMSALTQTELKSHGDELTRLVKFLVKTRTLGPIPTAEQEREWIASANEYLMKEADVKTIEVLDAGSEGKAANGLPCRPAVEVS